MFFPSTKRCSVCGGVKREMGLDEREYRCDRWGAVMDREWNAAIHLKQWGIDPAVRKLRRVPPEGTPVERAEDLRDQAALVEAGTEQQSVLCRFV